MRTNVVHFFVTFKNLTKKISNKIVIYFLRLYKKPVILRLKRNLL
jgi:hypothetical protein